jgi:hypothetical protein
MLINAMLYLMLAWLWWDRRDLIRVAKWKYAAITVTIIVGLEAFRIAGGWLLLADPPSGP